MSWKYKKKDLYISFETQVLRIVLIIVYKLYAAQKFDALPILKKNTQMTVINVTYAW